MDKPRTFTQQFAKAVDESPIGGSRSAPDTRGDDVTEVLAGLKVTASDEKAVEAYGGAAETAAQFESLCKLITEGVSAGSTEGEASFQLRKNMLTAYTAETYFGGHDYSVLNTSLRNARLSKHCGTI